MRRPVSHYDASVSAFRAWTAVESDGQATRARVLARAGRRTRSGALRPIMFGALGIVMTSMSAFAAWNGLSARWHASRALRLGEGGDLALEVPVQRARHPFRSIPPLDPATTVDAECVATDAASEARAYGRAHQLHFVEAAPARALAAWDDYLRTFPRGRLAPEARYNRALCLVRLGRTTDAERALLAFARAGDGYRRADAQRMLDWIHAQPSGDQAP